MLIFDYVTHIIVKIRRLSILIFTLLLFSCESGFDKSLISNAEKLISPGGEYTLYSYHVESPMSFGSGFSAINIFKSGEEYDFTDRDILRFGNAFPFWIKWKDKETLAVKCLRRDIGLQKHQPFKTEVVKWKEWIFEVEYYSMYSSGATEEFPFEKYSIDQNKIKFKSKNDSLVFNKNEMQFSLDSNHIYVKEFKITFFNNKTGLSFRNYDLTTKGDFNQRFLRKEQPFVSIKP